MSSVIRINGELLILSGTLKHIHVTLSLGMTTTDGGNAT